jgi:tetratricopeptide (TPR) repeat protein
MGLIHFREKKYKQAEAFFQRALEQEPTYHLSQFLLAKIYDATNRHALARRTYTKILEICPDCFDPMQALTMSYLRSGQFDMANLIVSNFLRISPIPEQELNRAKDLKRLVLRQSPANTRKRMENSAAKTPPQPLLRQ